MKTYSVTKLPANKAFMIEGDLVPNSTLVNIPDSDKRKHNFISYYVRIVSLEKAIETLSYISTSNPLPVNRGLFIAALADLIKSFDGSDKYSTLSYNKFATYNPQASKELSRFKKLRNTQYMHTSNRMTEAFAFLPVSPEGSSSVLGGVPSVIVDIEELDYVQESSCLIWVINEVRKYAVSEFDRIADYISKDYSCKSREELLAYGIVKAKPAVCE